MYCPSFFPSKCHIGYGKWNKKNELKIVKHIPVEKYLFSSATQTLSFWSFLQNIWQKINNLDM